jgi:uncharacterized Zn finger protein
VSFWSYPAYVSVGEKRAKAEREIKKLRKKGRAVSPVCIEGRKIARSFWGKAWCDNLERYADFDTRLPRGRSYVCNGLVIDLAISRGKVEALVFGSEIYKVKIDIALPAATRWRSICADCTGSVGSLVELLQGTFSKRVMERVCRDADGLFPTPAEMKLSCSCYDWADMCKHVAAALYGVGARLDSDPDVLFTLRGVNREELISTAGADLDLTRAPVIAGRVLQETDMAALFGIDIAAAPADPQPAPPARKTKALAPAVSVPIGAAKSRSAKRAAKSVTLLAGSSTARPSPVSAKSKRKI